jgi:hypothetical protein
MINKILDKHNITEDDLIDILYEHVGLPKVTVEEENVDNGIELKITENLDPHIVHFGFEVIAYTLLDQYEYGFSSDTNKKYLLTLYHI